MVYHFFQRDTCPNDDSPIALRLEISADLWSWKWREIPQFESFILDDLTIPYIWNLGFLPKKSAKWQNKPCFVNSLGFSMILRQSELFFCWIQPVRIVGFNPMTGWCPGGISISRLRYDQVKWGPIRDKVRWSQDGAWLSLYYIWLYIIWVES